MVWKNALRHFRLKIMLIMTGPTNILGLPQLVPRIKKQSQAPQ